MRWAIRSGCRRVRRRRWVCGRLDRGSGIGLRRKGNRGWLGRGRGWGWVVRSGYSVGWRGSGSWCLAFLPLTRIPSSEIVDGGLCPCVADESGDEPPEDKGGGEGRGGESGVVGKVVDDGVGGAGADEGGEGDDDEAEGGAVGCPPEFRAVGAVGFDLDVAVF